MDDRLARLEQSVADLTRAVQELDRRLVGLEARAGARAEAPALAAAPAQPESEGPARTDAVGVLSLVGRTFVVLGGAYLLRALTDSGTFPRPAGTALGLAYGIAWIVMAWRAAGLQRMVSVAFHGVAASLIVFPLLWEATVRFNLLSQSSSALAMAGVTTLGLAVAWHRRTQSLAWIITTGGLLAALTFMAAGAGAGQATEIAPAAGATATAVAETAGDSAAPMALYLAFLGVVTLWFGYTRDWTWLRWPVAFVADLTVVGMIITATEAWHRGQVGAVMFVQMILFAGYLVSFAARTLWRAREVVPFEVVQTLALLVVGFGGAVYLMLTTGSSASALGVASLVFGVGSYGVAFAFIDWRGGHWKNFVFYASLGAVFILAGTALTVGRPVQAVAWAVLGFVSAWGGRRYATITLSSHATIYAFAAAIVSGLLGHASAALIASATRAWTPLLLPAVVALAGAALSAAVPLSSANESWGRRSRLPKVVLVITLLWCTGGVISGLLVPALTGVPGGGATDAAIVASVRTAILGVSALFLGWAGRGLFVEGRWLMYVVLVAGALKLIIEDFPSGRPSTLFLALAIYGGALILGPRFGARARVATGGPPPAPR